ncbi:hypothetical protein EHF33_04250 [Deinococcus psychrotolerans]|uniref:Lipoprotein n=1 Tax=Deinococcus psychrotolerans TaxID=2489213 RepID=A0A3G8YCV7_9DEIO|nr:hypothetical protein [Deinococcus psychrotolerans]AZI42057.1 hypothetical protein EHF33_04250 [Deinococcus psychrotolerans]
MKLNAKMLLPALALPLLLAACGSASTGSGTVKFNDLKTEYRDANGKYVACDNTINQDGSTTTITNVGVYYTASGTVSSVGINLLGNTGSTYDANYSATVQGSNLQSIGGNDFKTIFTANSSDGLLPQAIVVKPNANVNIKTVTASNRAGGANSGSGFYAKLTINGNGQTASTNSNSALLPSIPVYVNCTVTAVTGDKL